MVDTTVGVKVRSSNRFVMFLKNLWPVSGAINEIASLDGLRAVAVTMTVVPHLLWAMVDSSRTSKTTADWLVQTRFFWSDGIAVSGVVLFFVLSGFLLFMPYARAMLGLQSFPSARKFYVRRALRILPAYWVSIVLLVLFFQTQYQKPAYWYDLGLHVFMVHNWTQETDRTLNTPFWTMAVESQYYVLLPLFAFVMFALAKARRYKLLAGLFLLLAAASPAYELAWSFSKTRLPEFFAHITILEVFGYMITFVVGMLCSLSYIAITQTQRVNIPVEKIQALARIAGLVGIGGYLIWLVGVNFWSPLLQMRQIIVGPCFGGILLGTLLGWPSWSRLFSKPSFRFIGVISYSLYIWNLPIYEHVIVPIAQIFGSDLITFGLGLLLTPVILIPFAFASYHMVERPFLKVRRKQH